MIYSVSVSTERVLDECIAQTSHDLKSMRTRGVDTADGVYNDWVMTRYDSVDLYSQLQESGSDLFNILRTFIVTYSAGQDTITYSVDIKYPKLDVDAPLNDHTLSYLKYSALAWWYQYRDVELSKMYEAKAIKASDAIFTLCMPRTGTIHGRYF